MQMDESRVGETETSTGSSVSTSNTKEVEVQTNPYPMEPCGCASVDLEAVCNIVKKEIQRTVEAIVIRMVQEKEEELEQIRKFMEVNLERMKQKCLCKMCGEYAQTYHSNAYYCSKKCEIEDAASDRMKLEQSDLTM
ncbi:hypothetical protein R5R35_001141 [Gryllus longicercus]|uniref:Uncharacterized protein n=1 Tax=Gryllus longicercus TaxID=2509291 RepID=A0AAN9VS52_9ORTH